MANGERRAGGGRIRNGEAMTSPINLRSEQIKRELAFERLIQDVAAATDTEPVAEPDEQDSEPTGATVIYILAADLIVLLLAAGAGALLARWLVNW